MTVSTTISRVDYLAGGGAGDVTFPYTFRIFNDEDLKVYVATVLQTLNVDYSVTGAGDGTGGNVVFAMAPTALAAVAIVRELDITQETDYVELDKFPAETHEAALDKLTMIAQETNAHIDTLEAAMDVYWSGVAPAGPWILSSDYPTIQAANTYAYFMNKLLVVDKAWTLGANTTLTAPIRIIPGGSFTKASTYTLTFSGSFENPSNGHCFIGFDAGDVTGLKEVVAEWFGCKGDNSTDNVSTLAVALNTAVNSGIKLKLSSGIYLSSGTITITDFHPTTSSMVNIYIEGTGCPDLLSNGNDDLARLGGTILKFTNADSTHGLVYSPTLVGTALYPSFTLKDIEIRGSGASSGDGIRLTGDSANGLTIIPDFQNVSVNTFAGGNGIYLYYCENGGGRNVTVNRNKYGMRITNASNANNWFNFVSQYNTDNGLIVYDSQTNGFFGGLVQNNPKNGVYINGGNEINFYNFHFEGNNTATGNTYYAAHVQGTTGYYNGRINFYGGRFSGAYDSVYLEGVVGGTTAYVRFKGSRSLATNSLTIADAYVYYTDYEEVLGGTITDNGTDSIPPAAWKAWTPSFATAVLSGYTVARYIVKDKICHFVFNAESKNLSGSAGAINITLPVAVTSTTTGYFVINTDILDGAAWVGKVHANIGTAGTTMNIFKTAAVGNWAANETGVTLRISGFYEVD